MNKIYLLLIGFILIGFGSALPTDSDVDLTFNYPINQSTLNVNNTEYFQGYTPSTLYTYYRGLLETYFDALYCKLTGCTMTGNINMGSNQITGDGGGYIDFSSDPISIGGADLDINSNTFINGDLEVWGTTNLTGTTWMTTGNTFVRDSANETHHLNVDLENLDELSANVFLTPLIVETFSNATGDYVNITSTDESSMTVNLQSGGTAQNYRLQYTNIILELTAGTNETPILNRVYVYLDSGVPTWTVSTTEPTITHAMVARILLGESGSIPYAASLQEDGYGGFVKRVQRVNRKRGLLYEDGFDYVASANDLQINNGTFINGIYDSSFLGPINVTDGFYLVSTDGTYQWYDDFLDITQYSDGNTIGTNKYFNVIFGITPYDGTGNIYAIVQSKPATEYTSVALAYADGSNTVKVFPSEEFLKLYFIPIARVIINEGSGAELLPNGFYAEDYRGGIAGGVASGGGLSETDPVWTADKPDYALLTDLNTDDGTATGQMAFWNNTSQTWVNTETSELFWDDVNKRLGAGTATPTSSLHIKGSGDSSATSSLAVENLGGSTLFKILNNGFVGIGTAPTVNMDIRALTGNAALNLVATNGNDARFVFGEIDENNGGLMTYDGGSNTFQIGTISAGSDTPIIHLNKGQSRVGIGASISTGPTLQITRRVAGQDMFEVVSTGGSFIIKEDGNVGIGTATPNNLFQVAGLINFDDTLNNIALGTEALKEVTTGQYNIALGGRTFRELTTGSYNMGVGRGAMEKITTGSNNVAVGNGAGYELRTGVQNMFIGSDAGRYNREGSYNVGIGQGSLKGVYLGSHNRNVGIGAYTGQNLDGAFGNVLIGYYAGEQLTTGEYNNFIGYGAGRRQTTNSNLLIVDNQLRADAATEATNAILYGVMASTPASQSLRINADTGLGVAPINKLDISGGAVIGSTYAGTNTAPTDGLLVEGEIKGSNLNMTGSIYAGDGFTGNCVNTSFVSGIAVGCND